MELKRNREVSVRAWYNESELVNESENWEVYSKDEDDTIYIFVKNPKTNNQLKLRIIKSCEIKDPDPEEIDQKEGES